jgi:TusA-related sulfurtransferase
METNEYLDITNENCPMTFVRVKLKLEGMEAGQNLTVRLNPGEPLINVPRSLKDEHYGVSEPQPDGDHFLIIVNK